MATTQSQSTRNVRRNGIEGARISLLMAADCRVKGQRGAAGRWLLNAQANLREAMGLPIVEYVPVAKRYDAVAQGYVTAYLP